MAGAWRHFRSRGSAAASRPRPLQTRSTPTPALAAVPRPPVGGRGNGDQSRVVLPSGIACTLGAVGWTSNLHNIVKKGHPHRDPDPGPSQPPNPCPSPTPTLALTRPSRTSIRIQASPTRSSSRHLSYGSCRARCASARVAHLAAGAPHAAVYRGGRGVGVRHDLAGQLGVGPLGCTPVAAPSARPRQPPREGGSDPDPDPTPTPTRPRPRPRPRPGRVGGMVRNAC